MNYEQLVTDDRAAGPLLFDSIVEHLNTTEEAFTITLATGDTLHFRHIQGRKGFHQIRAAAHRFAQGVNAVNAPPEVRPFVPDDSSTMIWCHILASLNLNEGSVWDFLELQHHGPLVFEDLLEQFQSSLLRVAEQVETDEIDRAKKEFGSRFFGETDSLSPKKPGDGTQGSLRGNPLTTQ